MEHKYRVAFIGCGHRARAHADGLKAEKRCNVVALADIKPEAAEVMNKEYGYEAAIYTDYKELLVKERPEIIIEALWTPLHAPVFIDCARAGVKAVLCEKPVAPTWKECLEMAEVAEETGCQLTFGHQRRFASGNRIVRKLVEEGRFGEIKRMDLYSPPHLLDCGTHTIDQAMSLNKENPVKWVLGAVDANNPINYFDVKAEQMAVGTMVFENGVRANIQVGGPDMDMWGGVRVIGTEGFIEVFWDGNLGQTVVYNDPSWQPPVIEVNHIEHMVGLVKNAVDALETGKEPELSYKKALQAVEVLFAFYESIRRQKRITLPLEGVKDNPFVTMLENGCFRRD